MGVRDHYAGLIALHRRLLRVVQKSLTGKRWRTRRGGTELVVDFERAAAEVGA